MVKKLNLCIIAQIENWRGGIQQYSQNYSEALAEKANVSVIGYKNYFPIWLYPGDKRTLKESMRTIRSNIVVYNVLKYYSLWSVLKAFRLIKNRCKADIVDIQWCTTFHAPILMPLIFLLKFFSKTPIFVTVHNVLPHENRIFDKFLCKIVYRMSDALVVHSNRMQNDLIQIFKINSNKILIIPHGVCFEYDKKIPKEEARRLLNIREKYVILFFGLVREYKGLWYLIRAFEKFYKDFDVTLLIAGDFIDGKEKYEKLINDSKIRNSVYIHARYIKDEEVPVFFAASDLLVQPYLNFSGQSGVPQTAYYYSLPIVASDVGGLPEIVLNKKTGLIVEPKNIDQIVEAIKFFLNNPSKMNEYAKNGKWFLKNELSWDSIVRKMLNNYSKEIRSE